MWAPAIHSDFSSLSLLIYSGGFLPGRKPPVFYIQVFREKQESGFMHIINHMCPKDCFAKLEFAEVRMTKWEVRSLEVRRAETRGILSPEGGSW